MAEPLGCNCGGKTAANNSDTLGYYVVLPNGLGVLPEGVNLDDPEAGSAPFFSIHEARRHVTLNGGGTIRRLRRVPVTT